MRCRSSTQGGCESQTRRNEWKLCERRERRTPNLQSAVLHEPKALRVCRQRPEARANDGGRERHGVGKRREEARHLLRGERRRPSVLDAPDVQLPVCCCERREGPPEGGCGELRLIGRWRRVGRLRGGLRGVLKAPDEQEWGSGVAGGDGNRQGDAVVAAEGEGQVEEGLGVVRGSASRREACDFGSRRDGLGAPAANLTEHVHSCMHGLCRAAVSSRSDFSLR